MQEPSTEHAPVNAQRGNPRRKAALQLFLLLGLPVLLLSSVFLTGAYWGSSRVPLWLLEKEASWFGWTASPELMLAAQTVENRRQGLGVLSSGGAVAVVPDAAVPQPEPEPEPSVVPAGADPALTPKQPAVEPEDSPPPADPSPQKKPLEAGPTPDKLAELPNKADSAPATPALAAPKIKQDPAQDAVRERTPPKRQLPALENPGTDPRNPQPNPGDRATTAKDRFDLPAKVGVMLVVDAQAFPGSDSCRRARSALHSANVQYRSWLNLSLDVRGCLPWEAKSEQKKERGKALSALDLPGTDLLMVLTRPGRVEMPALEIEKDVFNSGLSLALVPGGSDDAGMRRAMLHALGVALGAQVIQDPGSPDARRGSVMNAQPGLRRDWLDEPNRWRMLERKQWPFARRNRQVNPGGAQ